MAASSLAGITFRSNEINNCARPSAVAGMTPISIDSNAVAISAFKRGDISGNLSSSLFSFWFSGRGISNVVSDDDDDDVATVAGIWRREALCSPAMHSALLDEAGSSTRALCDDTNEESQYRAYKGDENRCERGKANLLRSGDIIEDSGPLFLLISTT